MILGRGRRRTHTDGSITVTDRHDRTLQLPADYVRDHVELGYATTVHRAQGRTVDTAHALIDETTTRENLYVAITRARAGNHVYLTAEPGTETYDLTHEHTTRGDLERLTPIVERSASTASAHAYLQALADLPDLPTFDPCPSHSQWIDPGLPSQGMRI